MALLDLGNRRSPNIYRVRYRSGINGRVATAFVKVPYGTLFTLTETLTRQMATGHLLWFRLDVAKTEDIALHRGELARPADALRATSTLTHVDWAA